MKNTILIVILTSVSLINCSKIKVKNCKPNEKIYNGACVSNCPYLTFLSDDMRTCVSNCKPGYGFIAPFYFCQPCTGNNKFKNGDNCIQACPRVSYKYDCLDSCPSNLMASYYDKDCVESCGPGELNLKEQRTCIRINQCKDGYFINKNECIGKCPVYSNRKMCVETCPSGKFASEDDKKCVDGCSSNQFVVKSTRQCLSKCPNNMFELKSECVNSCPSNYFTVNGQCLEKCPFYMFTLENPKRLLDFMSGRRVF
jgi:hypothetical protein